MLIAALLLVISLHAYEKTVERISKEIRFEDATYASARYYYLKNEFDKATPLLFKILRVKPDRLITIKVYALEYRYKAAPGALDMLGRIYLKNGRIKEALMCFDEMFMRYKNDRFLGAFTSLSSQNYGGPAGAEALCYEMWIFSNNFSGYGDCMIDNNPNYEKSINISKLLIKNFDGITRRCYGDCVNYEEPAADNIVYCLISEKAFVGRMENKIRWIIKNTKNRVLCASLLLELGELYRSQNNDDRAVRIFREVTKEYYDVYYFYAADNVARFYPLEAFGGILAILTEKNKANDIERLKGDIAVTYYEFRQEIERMHRNQKDYSGITRKHLNKAMAENIYKYVDFNVGGKRKNK